ncbi:MAG: hypothetical protein NC331_06345 [Lachnospiraceae bacterium]|nr:hypothetical protein [Lachnospiraceae bacterium]MCM1238990.1 hypothetical protein [Lachnospiraceae bacterium]
MQRSGEKTKETAENRIFSNDFHQYVMEADTWEDFKAGKIRSLPINCAEETLKIWEDLLVLDKQICSRLDDEYKSLIDDYAKTYLFLLEQLVIIISETGPGQERGHFVQQLELLLRWKLCKVNLENLLLIPRCHPMEIVVRALANELSDLADKDGSNLVKAILLAEQKRYAEYIIVLSDQVFLRKNREETFITQEGQYSIAVPLQDAGSFTEISSIRFIEKINHSKRTGASTSPIKLACMGRVTEPTLITEYFKNDLQLFEFKQVTAKGSRLMFQIEEECIKKFQWSNKTLFNLLSLPDLEFLFNEFDIVFFMDESCFYSAGQAGKTLEERNIAAQLKWLHTMSAREKQTEKKLLYYRKEFETIGRWLSVLDKDATAHLQFNEHLFYTIQNAMRSDCDVYLYISHGRQIGEMDLYNRNICNDENYGGKELSVYKMSHGQVDLDAYMKKLFTNNDGDDRQCKVWIDLWKLVKSINNDYYRQFLQKGSTEPVNELDGIRLLKESYLVLCYPKTEKAQKVLCGLKLAEKPDNMLPAVYDQLARNAKDFLKELVKEGLQEPKYNCVSQYLRNLLANGVISRAKNVVDILFGFLLKREYFYRNFEWVDMESVEAIYEEMTDIMEEGLFETRRIVLSVIRNLNEVWLRDLGRGESFLMYDFRNKYCAGLSEEIFLQLLQEIHKACETLGFQESRVYNYSNL